MKRQKIQIGEARTSIKTRVKYGRDVGIIREFKTTMINMQKALKVKVDNMQEQMCNMSKKGYSKKNQKEIKTTNGNEECL